VEPYPSAVSDFSRAVLWTCNENAGLEFCKFDQFVIALTWLEYRRLTRLHARV